MIWSSLLVGWLALPLSRAHEPPPVVSQLLAASAEGTLDEAWIRHQIDPGPGGWTSSRLQSWLHALRPGGPSQSVLRHARGILHVSEPGAAGHRHVVLDSQPRLLVHVQPDGRLRALRPTACDRCTDSERWVRDLQLSLKASGGHGPRLRVATDLDLTDHLTANRHLSTHRWPALLDRRLRDDLALRRQLSRSRILSAHGSEVRLQWAGGPEDVWTVRFEDGEGRLVYDALPASSPLRLSLAASRKWRGQTTRHAVRTASWEPSWAPLSDGHGVEIGHGAVAAVVDPHDETVLVVALDIDRTLSSVFRVDPWTRRVVNRIDLPVAPQGRHVPVPEWTRRWPAALSPDTHHLAVASPAGLLLVDLRTAEVTSRGWLSTPITALAWRHDGTLLVGREDGRLKIGDQELTLGHGTILAVAAAPDGSLTAWTSDGTRWDRRPDLPPETTRVCASRIERILIDHHRPPGLIACQEASRRAPSPEARGLMLPAGSPDWPALPPHAPEGPVFAVSIDATGDRVVGLTTHGHVGWWSRSTLNALAQERVP